MKLCTATYSLLEFARNPKSQREYFVPDPIPKRIAGLVVEGYAKHLEQHPHLAAVNSHMQLPDNADNLLGH